MSQVAAVSQTVTIAATVGTVTFSDLNGLVTMVYVSPVGSPSAANAKLSKTVASKDIDLVASEAVSTTATVALFNSLTDGGTLAVTAATPLKVVFNTATNGNQYTVTVEYVRG